MPHNQIIVHAIKNINNGVKQSETEQEKKLPLKTLICIYVILDS